MKATISFFSVLAIIFSLGFYFAPEKSDAALVGKDLKSGNCTITGLTTARGTGNPSDSICAYNSNNEFMGYDLADRWGYFIIGGMPSGQNYRLVCYQPGNCTKIMNRIACGSFVDFRPLPAKCF